jgi:predicted dinucleotide-binding enzyme
MKLRSLFVFGAGMLAGLALAKKMTEDDPEVMHGPAKHASQTNPALRAVTSGAQRLADKAGVASLDAIRRTRGMIRERLGEDGYEDAAWS